MPRVAVVPGDGIGVEVIAEAVAVLRQIDRSEGLGLELVPWDLGAERYLRTGVTITEEEMAELATDYDAILLGALGDPRVPGNEHARDILLGMRFRLDLYVNLRPVRLLHPAGSPLKAVGPGDIDMVIFRENTEGSYVGMGGVFKQGTPDEVAIEEDISTRKGVERIIRAAFEHADRAGRRLTLADKSNALRHSGQLWRRVFREVGAEHPGVETGVMYIDALATDLVLRPGDYQVIVTSNLFGDILSDLAAGLVGGLGLAPSANLHPGRIGLFEPVHGSAPDIAGQGKANPVAAILAAALMLDHLGHPAAARRVEEAVEASIREGATTPDLGGTLGTTEVGARIRQRLP
ncbi:MAG TPA: 3-isopropylmalate dehydrogenase [Longimicrobiales bacterium]|nr:3-isopropylmalate dehydrogenase [Longimicrobiales bacterium]